MDSPGDITVPVEFSQGAAIFELLEKSTPDLTDYNSKRDSIFSTILTFKQQNLYKIWFGELVEASVIVNNVEKAINENPDFL